MHASKDSISFELPEGFLRSPLLGLVDGAGGMSSECGMIRCFHTKLKVVSDECSMVVGLSCLMGGMSFDLDVRGMTIGRLV